MSSPVMLACAAAAVCLGLPVMSAAAHLEASHRAAVAADAAALAAADALGGWIDGDPCELAHDVARSMGAQVADCVLEQRGAVALVSTSVGAPLGTVIGSARAGPEFVRTGPDAEVGSTGWAWPSEVRGVSQGFHDGYAIDLAIGPGGALYSPYDGVVVSVGADGGGVPGACVANPAWWRGPNQSIVVRHEYRGRVLYSSHNHIAPGSPGSLGIAVGARVRAGQRIATAGMSGCTSGPHTHFTLASHETNAYPDVDPFVFLGRP